MNLKFCGKFCKQNWYKSRYRYKWYNLKDTEGCLVSNLLHQLFTSFIIKWYDIQYTTLYYVLYKGFPDGSDGKESTCNTGNLGLTPRSGRSPGEGNCNPLEYSCLENPMDSGAWGHKELDMTEWLTLSCIILKHTKYNKNEISLWLDLYFL